MWLFILLSTLAILLLSAYGLITYARWNFGSLESQGIPVVKPQHFLLGGAMLAFEKNGGLLDVEHMKKYGPVFGLYEGREAQIFFCDAEMIRLVTTKDAEYFDAKRVLDFGDPLFNEFLDFQHYQKWKMLRGMISPVVNSGVRLKNAGPGMRDAIGDFIRDIKQNITKSGGTLENYQLNTGIFGMLADLLARGHYSISMSNSNSGTNRLVEIIRILTAPPPATASAWIATYVYAFPFLKKLLPNTIVNPVHSNEFVQIVKQIIEHRRQENNKFGKKAAGHNRDFLDHLVEWFDGLKTNAEYKSVGINDMSIYNLGLGLFIAGQDQIALILSAVAYCISKDKTIERKLHQELDSVWAKNNGVFDHESLSELPYLSACVLEATRLYPFFYRAERVCTKDWRDETTGISVKKGQCVQIPIWAANRNPKYFENPEEFQPERFMPGNKEKMHAYAFTSFGFGPRNCLGKRLALETMNILAAYLFRELKFLGRKDTALNFIPAGPFFAACEPIVFDVQAR